MSFKYNTSASVSISECWCCTVQHFHLIQGTSCLADKLFKANDILKVKQIYNQNYKVPAVNKDRLILYSLWPHTVHKLQEVHRVIRNTMIRPSNVLEMSDGVLLFCLKYSKIFKKAFRVMTPVLMFNRYKSYFSL